MSFLGQPFLIRFLLVFAAFLMSTPLSAITLQDAFESAVRVDPALRSSKYNQDASAENISIARSRLLPQVSLQGTSSRLTQTTIQNVPGSSSLSRSFTGPSINHQLVLRQDLLRTKDISGLNFAEIQAQFGKVKYFSDLSDLWTRVTFAWIDLVGTTQLVQAYESPLSYLLAAASQEKARLIQGDGTKDAAIEAEAQYQLALSMHQQARHSLEAKQKAFEVLTQADARELHGLKLDLNPNPNFSEADRDRLWASSREKSFDIRFAELQELLQRERVRMSRADHMPTIDVIVALNIAKNDATSTQGYRYLNNQVGIQYTVPIYAGGSISAADRQATFALQASIADKEAVSNRVEGDFRALWSAWLGQLARVRAGNQLVESSKAQLRAAQLSYVQGIKTVTDVANAELLLARRNADQINTVMDYQKYEARLSKSDFKLMD